MIDTVDINKLEKEFENVYEAVVVLAKRARQINDDQKQLVAQEQEEYDEDYDAYDEEREVIEERTNFIRLPKPTSVALEELEQEMLEFKYRQPEEEGPESEQA